jgi:hypothetical protein
VKKGDNARGAKRQAIAKAIARKSLPVASALLANDDLTENQKAYVENRAYGLNKQDAARAAGYSDAAKEALRLEQLGFSREDVMNGLKKAIDDAVILADPQAQIAGWREIAKMCGYYAPEIKQHILTSGQQAVRGQMETLSDDELLRLADQRNAIPGEATRIPDHDSTH